MVSVSSKEIEPAGGASISTPASHVLNALPLFNKFHLLVKLQLNLSDSQGLVLILFPLVKLHEMALAPAGKGSSTIKKRLPVIPHTGPLGPMPTTKVPGLQLMVSLSQGGAEKSG